jgi:hypothetical protein
MGKNFSRARESPDLSFGQFFWETENDLRSL